MLLYNWSENQSAWKILRFQSLSAPFIKNCQYFLRNNERHTEHRLLKSRQPWFKDQGNSLHIRGTGPLSCLSWVSRVPDRRSNYPSQGLISLLPREVEFLHKAQELNPESLRYFHPGKANHFSVRHSSDTMALAWALAPYSTYWFNQVCF